MTRKQKRTLDFIRAFVGRQGISPTYREIMTGLGAKSMSQVFNLVVRLEQAGHLTTRPGEVRSIRLTESVDTAAERLLDNIVSENPEADRVVVRAQDIAELDLALSHRRRAA